MTKKLKLTETDLINIITKIVKEDDELLTNPSEPMASKDDYSDTSPIRKISMAEVTKNLWEIQGLLKDCSPAMALSRLVILLEELGETTDYQEDRHYPCNADGPNDISESKQSINEENVKITQATMERYMNKKFKEQADLIIKYNQK